MPCLGDSWRLHNNSSWYMATFRWFKSDYSFHISTVEPITKILCFCFFSHQLQTISLKACSFGGGKRFTVQQAQFWRLYEIQNVFCFVLTFWILKSKRPIKIVQCMISVCKYIRSPNFVFFKNLIIYYFFGRMKNHYYWMVHKS